MGVQRKHVNELCNNRRNVTAATALILARVGKVSLGRHYQTRDVASESEPAPDAPKPKRRYRRRDMTAETE